MEKAKSNIEQKQMQSDKEKEKKTKRGDTASMGEERIGGSGPSGTSGGEDVKASQHGGSWLEKEPIINDLPGLGSKNWRTRRR